MPNNIKVSDMEQAVELTKDDLVMIAQPNIDPENPEAEVESYSSKKTTIKDLADETVKSIQYTEELQTDSKTITGAINEAAQVGKISKFYSSIDFDYVWKQSGVYEQPSWDDIDTTPEGQKIYQSKGGTYLMPSGNSPGSYTVEGYDDVTFYIKQDDGHTDAAYIVLGKPNTTIDLEDSDTYIYSGKNNSLTEYTAFHFENLYGNKKEFQVLYQVDSAPAPTGTATIDLNNGQWVDSGTEVDGHTVYKSTTHSNYGTSLCTINLSGVKSIAVYCKPSSESSYDITYLGELDSNDPSSDYERKFSGIASEYGIVSYIIPDDGNNHFIKILYKKDSSSSSGDDCGYIYFVVNGVNEDRGYIYIVPGTVHETSVGEVFNNYNSNYAIATYCHAEGSGTMASGESSHAEGSGTKALYSFAHAEGCNTKATGHATHAEGNGTLAAQSNSHAEGDYTQALNNYAHAEGEHTTASGTASHAEGNYTTASGYTSHAEGNQTTASGENSHAEGYDTVASGRNSHAEGYDTVASGEDSHVEGYQSQALGNYCHAEGYTNVANCQGAHAEGSRNVASKLNSHAEGESTKAIGVGAHSEGGFTTASGKYSHAEGSNLNYNTEGPIASGVAAHAEGILTKAEGMGAHAEGIPVIKYQEYSSTTTYNTDDIIYYFSSYDNTDTVLYFARAKVDNIQGISPEDNEGWRYWDSYSPSDLSSYFYSDGNGHYSSTAIGKGAHAEGMLAIASGTGSHAEGYITQASGDGSHAEGYGYTNNSLGSGPITASGIGAHAEGTKNTASGNFSHAEGVNNEATMVGAHAEGNSTHATGMFSHTEGFYTVASGHGAHAEGHPGGGGTTTASGNGSHAEGSGNTASGDYSHAEGTRNSVYSESGHVEGSGHQLYGHEAHIEGSGNRGTEYSSHTEGAGNTNIAKNAHMEGGGNRNVSMSTISHTEGAGNTNYGAQSHIEGGGNTVSGNESHVEGGGNEVHGLKSHVEGGGNGGYGIGAHVEGKHNTAFGYAQHAEGAYNIVGYSSTPQQFNYSNDYAKGAIVCINNAYYGSSSSETDMPFIFRCITAPGKIQSGNGVTIIHPSEWSSSATYSQGDVVKVSGYGFYKANSSSVTSNPVIKHSDNGGNDWTKIQEVLSPFRDTSSSGYYLLDCLDVYGSNDIAIVDSGVTVYAMWEPVSTSLVTHVEGLKNIATGDYQHVQGKYNNPDPDQAFIIGNGLYAGGITTRSNALTVDWSGNMALAGDVTVGTSLNTTATTIGGAINEIVARIPAPPTVDGTYTLSVTVSSGDPTFSWVAASS